MPDGQVLEFTHVTKRFNEVTAVSDFSARIEPGAVTAFLGPNGAGKTTTLRILLGQIRATSGTATIGGVAYSELRQPLRAIGSVLEDTAYRPRRSATRQLTIAAKANGIPLSRVDEVLSLVGLGAEADSRIGGFSLGMRQRLSVAHALLGDPGALVFDEPANGLDPEGIRWMRLLMRRLADEGRTVLVSSHVLSEVEQVADNVLVLSKGHLVLDSGIETLADPTAGSVVVDAADRAGLTAALSAEGFDLEVLRSGLTVRGGDAGRVGAVAAAAGIALTTLVQRGPTLEDVFIELVRGGKLDSRAELAATQLVATDGSGASTLTVAEAGPSDDGETADADTAADGEQKAPVEDAIAAELPVDDATAVAPVISAQLRRAVPAAGAAAVGVADGESSTDGASQEQIADASDDEPVPASDEAVSDEALSDEAVGDEAGSATSEHAPARSFDEILFGAAPTSAAVAGDAPDAQEHDVAAVFAAHAPDDDRADAADETPEVAPRPDVEEGDADGARPDETAPEDVTEDAPAEGPDAAAEGADASAEGADAERDHAGVEFFTELQEDDSEPSDESARVASEDEDSSGTADDAAADEDPRSAAVSSMLAAAARAYYEDEPRDYPHGAPASVENAPEGGAQWSVASTGVIDTVPVGESADDGETAPEGENEHHEGGHEHHHGDHHHG